MASSRLYCPARVTGHARGKRNSKPTTSLVQIAGVANREEAEFYFGKRIAYVYKAQKAIGGTKVRVIWGRISRAHGNSGMVRAQFRVNLPPHSFGASARVMLYPSRI